MGHPPLRTGITGNIGAGKTTACRIFAALGIAVFEADQWAKRLLMSDAAVQHAVKQQWGEECFRQGKPDTQRIAEKVFSDSAQLQWLNNLLHPRVWNAFQSWCQRQQGPYVLMEAALLFEAGFDKSLDKIIVVMADESLRIQRTAQRTGWSLSAIRARMAWQWPQENKKDRADFVIINDEVHPLLPQVLRIHEQLGGLPLSTAAAQGPA